MVVSPKALLFLDNDAATVEAVRGLLEDSFPELAFLTAISWEEVRDTYENWKDALALVVIEDHFVADRKISVQVINWLRRKKFAGTILAIFDFPPLMQKMVMAGCDDILQKPFSIDDLLSAIAVATWRFQSCQ